MKRFISVLKKYAVFDGRARRSEFWTYSLMWLVIYWTLSFIEIFIFNPRWEPEFASLSILSFIFAIATFLPSLGVQIRRLHDTGRSGWVSLLNFVPFVGFIIVIVFLATDSQPGPNKYGPNPKGIGNEPEVAGQSPVT